MPTTSTLQVFAVAALALLVVPGPSVLYITSRSARQGRRAGIVSVLGVHTGSIVHAFAAVAGISAVLVASAAAFTVVKVVGGIYLVWLGARTITQHVAPSPLASGERRSLRRLYRDGVVVSVLNPKVALFFLAFLPQFIDKQRGPVWLQTLVLGSTFIVLGVISDSAYAIASARLGGWLSRRSRRPTRGRWIEGGILVGLGISTLAIPHRRSR